LSETLKINVVLFIKSIKLNMVLTAPNAGDPGLSQTLKINVVLFFKVTKLDMVLTAPNAGDRGLSPDSQDQCCPVD
jgi:hypothetical protein